MLCEDVHTHLVAFPARTLAAMAERRPERLRRPVLEAATAAAPLQRAEPSVALPRGPIAAEARRPRALVPRKQAVHLAPVDLSAHER
eukprot:1434169-Prymnesium_polylepis.5